MDGNGWKWLILQRSVSILGCPVSYIFGSTKPFSNGKGQAVFPSKKARWFDLLSSKTPCKHSATMFRRLISSCILGWLGNPSLITICIYHFDSRVWVKFPSNSSCSKHLKTIWLAQSEYTNTSTDFIVSNLLGFTIKNLRCCFTSATSTILNLVRMIMPMFFSHEETTTLLDSSDFHSFILSTHNGGTCGQQIAKKSGLWTSSKSFPKKKISRAESEVLYVPKRKSRRRFLELEDVWWILHHAFKRYGSSLLSLDGEKSSAVCQNYHVKLDSLVTLRCFLLLKFANCRHYHLSFYSSIL